MLNKKQRSTIVKKAIAGKDLGKKGKGFDKVVNALEGKYTKEIATKIAAAQMWKSLAKKKK